MQNPKVKKIKPQQVELLEDAQDQLLSPHKINDYKQSISASLHFIKKQSMERFLIQLFICRLFFVLVIYFRSKRKRCPRILKPYMIGLEVIDKYKE